MVCPLSDKSGHCSALAHIANSGIFPVQSLKQGTKCRISTTRLNVFRRPFRAVEFADPFNEHGAGFFRAACDARDAATGEWW